MTVQELREEIVQKTEEINGYLESRDADKAEEALAEKRKLQKLLAVREAEDDEEREDLGRQKKQKESRSTGAVRSVINGWCKSQSRGEYKRVYQSNEINAYANEACYQRI